MRFLGNSEAKTDAKGRVFLPAIFRKQLQVAAEDCLVMRKDTYQDCLILYPESAWNKQMNDLRSRLNNWRWVYNEIRPHHSLGLKTPSSVYQPSTRLYYEPKPYIYDEGARLIKVNNWGYIRFGPMQLFLSEAMADTHIEIRFDDNDTFSILYRNYKIASVDAIEQKLIERHIRRL